MSIVGGGSTCIAMSTFFLIRAYARRFGEDDLSAFLLFRLASSVIVAFFTLGLPIALQRTVAYLRSDPSRASSAAIVGVSIGVLSIAGACTVCAAFAVPLATLMEYPTAARL